jgi:hypothetical protein
MRFNALMAHYWDTWPAGTHVSNDAQLLKAKSETRDMQKGYLRGKGFCLLILGQK